MDMDQLLFILIGCSVAALLWAAGHVVSTMSLGRKRKLHQRLSVETRSEGQARTNRPLLLQSQSTGLPALLNNLPPVQVLQRRVSQAFPELPLARFLFADAAIGLFSFALAALGSGSTLAGIVIGGVAAYLPFMIVSLKRGKRQRLITQQLPEALDFLSRVLRAGQSFSTGLQMMSEELPNPLAGEFRRCYDQHSLGQPIEDTLRDMALRLESSDVAFFATAVVIQRQSGGDMAEVLSNISHMVRQRLRLQQSVRAKTAEGRFTGYIMVGFPAVMFCLAWMLNPEYGGVLLHTSQGHMLLGTAFGLQMLGLYLIKRITTVKV